MIILGFHARCSLWPGLLQFQALSQQSVARWRGSPATTRWSSQACSGAQSVRRSEAALSRCRLHAQDSRAVTQGLDGLSHVRSLTLEHVKVACLPPRLDALVLVRCRLKECPLPQGWRLQSLSIRSCSGQVGTHTRPHPPCSVHVSVCAPCTARANAGEVLPGSQKSLPQSVCAAQSGSVCSPGGSNHPIDLEHWVTRSRPKHLSVLGTQVQRSRDSLLQCRQHTGNLATSCDIASFTCTARSQRECVLSARDMRGQSFQLLASMQLCPYAKVLGGRNKARTGIARPPGLPAELSS